MGVRTNVGPFSFKQNPIEIIFTVRTALTSLDVKIKRFWIEGYIK